MPVTKLTRTPMDDLRDLFTAISHVEGDDSVRSAQLKGFLGEIGHNMVPTNTDAITGLMSPLMAGEINMTPNIRKYLPKGQHTPVKEPILPPEMAPVGGEAAYNAQIQQAMSQRPSTEDNIYQHLMQYFKFLGQ